MVEAPLRIAIPIVAGIGNALMTIPLVRQLKRAMPQARVIITARISAMAECFTRLPEVDEVRVMKKGTAGMVRSMLQLGRPDVMLIPFPSNRWQYMMLALASGARQRLLHAYPVGGLSALGILPAHRMPAVKGLHDVAQNLYLLRLLGIEPDINEAPAFPAHPGDHARAEQMLADAGLAPDQRPIVVHPGSARTILAEAKRWPPEQYAMLIQRLADCFGDRVVLFEGPDEAGVAGEILRHHAAPLRVLRLSGPLFEAAAVLRRAELYVGSDSGLAHLAAAVGTPPVTLFAPADPDRVCPFGYRHLVVQPAGKTCTPCFMYPWESTRPRMSCSHPMCIREIAVEQVMEAVARAVEHPEPRRPH